MKKFLKVFLAFLFVFSFSVLFACNNSSETPDDKKDDEKQNEVTIELDYKGGDLNLVEGDEQVLNVTLKGAEGLEYSVDKADVLKVENGKVTALSAGTCVITVSVKDHSDKKVTINVTVTAKVVEPTKYTISYDLDGGTAEGLALEFEENSFPTLKSPTKEGFNFLGWFEGEDEITSISENKNYTLKAKWEVKEILPESIEITISCDDEIIYSDTECVITCRVLPAEASQEVEWKNMNRTKATLNEDGTINIMHGNEATFKATSVANPDVFATITVKVRTYPNPDNFIEGMQVKTEDIVAQKAKQYTSNAGSDAYILGSVIRYLFEKLTVTENMIPEGQWNRPGQYTDEGVKFKAYYVCVHDVGAPGDATSNSRYCVSPGQGNYISWHFTVGNDGVYQQLPMNEIGYHAGDGTHYDYGFRDSGIIAPEGNNEAAVIKINQVTGKFMIGDKDTLIDCPRNNSGGVPTNSQLPYTGISNYVDTDPTSETYRHYMIGDTWWSQSYQTVSNRGGNVNSIGIESQVTANTFYTWERMAKLIAQVILPETGLQLKDIKQHNTFSGKDCPMTMRHAGRWETFLDYVYYEYMMASQFYSFKLEFSTDSVFLNPNGMIKSLPNEATEVSYSVRFYSETEGYDKTFNYTVTLPAKSVIQY